MSLSTESKIQLLCLAWDIIKDTREIEAHKHDTTDSFIELFSPYLQQAYKSLARIIDLK